MKFDKPKEYRRTMQSGKAKEPSEFTDSHSPFQVSKDKHEKFIPYNFDPKSILNDIEAGCNGKFDSKMNYSIDKSYKEGIISESKDSDKTTGNFSDKLNDGISFCSEDNKKGLKTFGLSSK